MRMGGTTLPIMTLKPVAGTSATREAVDLKHGKVSKVDPYKYVDLTCINICVIIIFTLVCYTSLINHISMNIEKRSVATCRRFFGRGCHQICG